MEEETETFNVVEVNTFSTDDDYMICACGECFNSDETLKKHLIEKHANGDIVVKEGEDEVVKPKENVCEFCNKSYNNVRSLNIHRTHAHLGTKQKHTIVCPECGRSCSSRLALENHIRTHTGEKPFICPICARGFNANLLLQMHIRTHTGERPYICRLCPKAFASRSGLTRHKRVHSGDKPYECEVCEKRFSQSNSCKLHYLTVHLKQPCPYKRKPRVKKPKTDEYEEMNMYEVMDSGDVNEMEVIDEVAEVEMDQSEVIDAVQHIEIEYEEDRQQEEEEEEQEQQEEEEMTQYEIVESKDEEVEEEEDFKDAEANLNEKYQTKIIYENDDEIVKIKEEVIDHNYMNKTTSRRGPARESNVRKVVLANDNLMKQTNNDSPMRQLVLVKKTNEESNNKYAVDNKTDRMKDNLKKSKAIILKSDNKMKQSKTNKDTITKKLMLNTQKFNDVEIKIEKTDEETDMETLNVPIKVENTNRKKIILNQKNFVPITMVDNKPLYVLKRGRLTQETQNVVVLKNNAVILQQNVKPTAKVQVRSLPILRKAVPLKQHPYNVVRLK